MEGESAEGVLSHVVSFVCACACKDVKYRE